MQRKSLRRGIANTGTAADFSPVLRITALEADGTAAPMVFPGGNTYYILRSGNGSHVIGLEADWNPSELADINHLKVKVQNGTTDQGTSCSESRNIFNWSRIAYTTAVSKQDKYYRLGGMGPDYYDCSGLVLSSYNSIGLFPDFDTSSVRTAEQIHNWAQTHTSPTSPSGPVTTPCTTPSTPRPASTSTPTARTSRTGS